MENIWKSPYWFDISKVQYLAAVLHNPCHCKKLNKLGSFQSRLHNERTIWELKGLASEPNVIEKFNGCGWWLCMFLFVDL